MLIESEIYCLSTIKKLEFEMESICNDMQSVTVYWQIFSNWIFREKNSNIIFPNFQK